MKTRMRSALWACFVLIAMKTQAGGSMSSDLLRDTIILLPDTNIKVLVIHEDSKELTSYSRIDTIIDIMISDVQRARTNPDYPKAPRTTHYFISNDARRKLKTESEDFLEQGVDVQKESRALNLGLYPYAWFIHDNNGVEVQIYLTDPAKLEQLRSYNFAKAIRTIADDRDIMRKNCRADLTRKDSEWMLMKKQRNRNDLLEITPEFGFGLIGNQWSPSVGLTLFLEFSNKYGRPKQKVGLGLMGYTFAPSNTLDFENLNFVQSYSLKWMYNVNSYFSTKESTKFFGLSAGLLKTSKESSLDNRYKVGIVTEGIGPFSFAFDLIFLKEKKSVYGMTMLIPF